MHQTAQLERDVTAVLDQLPALGAQRPRAASSLGDSRDSTTIGTVGTEAWTLHSTNATPSAARSAGARPRPRQALASDVSSSRRRRSVASTSGKRDTGPGARIERVEPDGAARSQRHRSHAPGIGQVRVLPLGVDDPGPAAEHRLAPQERLDEGALPPADLAEDHHVRVRHGAGGVELEGVEHEGASEEVITHDDTAVPKPRLGDERIGGAQVSRGHLVDGKVRHAISHHG